MTATFEVAMDEILGVFKTAWDTTGFVALYENIAEAIPTTQVSWARATLRNSTGRQATLSGANAAQRYRREGFLTVQIFIPIGEGLPQAYSLSKVVTDAFQGTTTASEVWFRNIRVNEIGPDGEWFQTNVIIDFTYDEVG